MKSTELFKESVLSHLQGRAADDELFAVSFAKPEKNIDDCITYVLNWVKQSGCNGFTDDEIFGQAVHYYEEDVLEIGKPLSMQVVVNHKVTLTGEEIEQARQEAIRQVQSDNEKRMTALRPKPKALVVEMPSLF